MTRVGCAASHRVSSWIEPPALVDPMGSVYSEVELSSPGVECKQRLGLATHLLHTNDE